MTPARWVCKGDCWPEDWQEYWDIDFICVGMQDRILIDINYHYQITMNQHKNWTEKLNSNIYKVTFLLYQLLFFLNLFVVNLFRQRDCKKKVSTGSSWLFFISPGRWIGNEQHFKVGLNYQKTKQNKTWQSSAFTKNETLEC